MFVCIICEITGTGLIASLQEGRHCIAIDQSKDMLKIAQARLNSFPTPDRIEEGGIEEAEENGKEKKDDMSEEGSIAGSIGEGSIVDKSLIGESGESGNEDSEKGGSDGE